MRHIKAQIYLQPSTVPVFVKPRTLLYALKAAVGRNLDKLESQDTINKMERSESAAPLVVVPEKGGTLRFCRAYKLAINRCIQPDPCALPNTKDLLATLAGLKHFSKVDLFNS